MLMSGALMPMCAQEAWTIDRCMAYAVEHSHRVRQAAEASDSYRSQRNAAAAAFVSQTDTFGQTRGPDRSRGLANRIFLLSLPGMP